MSFDAVTYAVSKKYTKNRIDSSGVKGDKGDKGNPGPQGPKGDTGTLEIGTVTSGEPASITKRTENGIDYADFVLPKGDKGDKVSLPGRI